MITRSSGARHAVAFWHQRFQRIHQSLVTEHWYGVFLVRGHRHLRGVDVLCPAFMRQMRAKLVKNSSAEKSFPFLALKGCSDSSWGLPFSETVNFPVNLGTVRILPSNWSMTFLRPSGKGFVIFWFPPVFQATVLVKRMLHWCQRRGEISWAMTAPIPP